MNWMNSSGFLLVGSLLLMLSVVVAPPVQDKKPKHATEDEHFMKYVQSVVELIHSHDPAFMEKVNQAVMKNISFADLGRHLNMMQHSARTSLDDLKRQEVDRLRKLVEVKHSRGEKADHVVTAHIGTSDIEKFTDQDLERMIRKATHDLEEVDHQRREEFKQYEMEKEYVRQKALEKMTPEERQKAEAEHKAQMEKHGKHAKQVHHPGSKDQLEEVWEKEDHMAKEDFNPKAFFMLHDIDGNGMWDEEEVEALFQKELDKVYDPDASEDDMAERYEEMARMREHVVKEMDANKDGNIEMEEFLSNSGKPQFDNDEPWKTMDEDGEEDYTSDEFKDFEGEMDEMLENDPDIMHHQANEDALFNAGVPHHEAAPADSHHNPPPPYHENPAPPHYEQPAPPQQHHEAPIGQQHASAIHPDPNVAHHEGVPPAEHHEVPLHHEAPPAHHEVPPPGHHPDQQQHHESPPNDQHGMQQPSFHGGIPSHHEGAPPIHHEMPPPHHEGKLLPQEHHEVPPPAAAAHHDNPPPPPHHP